MFHRPLRKKAARFLLALMVLAVTPRSVLHHCALADEVGHANGKAAIHQDGHCAICEAALPVATMGQVDRLVPSLPILAVIRTAVLLDPSRTALEAARTRGPPVG